MQFTVMMWVSEHAKSSSIFGVLDKSNRYCLGGYPAHDRRRDFAKSDGSQVRASMMFQPCFLAVEKKDRMSAKSTAPSAERKPPEIFWRSFIMRPSRSA